MSSCTRHPGFRPSLAIILLLAACADATSVEMDCTDPPAVDAAEASELYHAAWSEADRSERACMIQRSLADDAILIADATAIAGRSAIVDELDARVAELLDARSSRDASGPIEARHDEARLPWATTDPSGAVLERGEDWLEFAEDGLLARIHILAGPGTEAPLGASLLAWQRAWNAADEAARADALRDAVTADVRFTDAVADITGRDPLGVEIARQQDAFVTELRLGDRIEVFVSADDEPILIRVPGDIVVAPGASIHVVDYIRLRDGHIERLSGFPQAD